MVIAGAGPGGSRSAIELARAGLKVLLLEEHAQVGTPLHCSGLVTPRTIHEAGIGPWVVQHQISGGIVHSSFGGSLRLGGDRVRALVIDRQGLDRWLAQQAVEAGAELALGCRLETIEREGRILRLGYSHQATRRYVTAPLLIGADGAGSRVARFLGQRSLAGRIRAMGATVSIPHQTEEHSVRVFAGDSLAPGWFGWMIPQGNGIARVGIGTAVRSQASPRQLLNQLSERFPEEFAHARFQTHTGGIIPLYQPIRTYGDNVMLVGDAARQVKPFSGGGIRTALVGARLSAQAALEALETGDLSASFLARYEHRWRREMGKEFETELHLRSIARHLDEVQLHHLILCLGHPLVQYFTRQHGDIDFPARLFSRMVRQRSLRRMLLRLPFVRESIRDKLRGGDAPEAPEPAYAPSHLVPLANTSGGPARP